MLNDREDAYALLSSLNAPPRLLQHLKLVGEAADQLIGLFNRLQAPFDARLVQLGVAVHDAGKVLFPQELDNPGSAHEAAGRDLMLAHGVQPEIANCCVTHAAWEGDWITFEERLVALSDKLWKGRREEELELLVIDAAADRLGADRWSIFTDCDAAFEVIAAGASDRLARS